MIWREKQLLLIILGVLLVANTVFFFTYRVQYERRLEDLEERRHDSEARLTQAHSARVAAERRVSSYRTIQHDVDEIFNQQWATQNERLGTLITEVKRLAVASNLVPASYSFSRVEEKKSSFAGVEATVVGINFNVQGTYEQVRRLINLLELSRQFIIIDQISLHSTNDQNLTLTLQLKTLFRDTTPTRAANRDL